VNYQIHFYFFWLYNIRLYYCHSTNEKALKVLELAKNSVYSGKAKDAKIKHQQEIFTCNVL
jgi:hypothetical protein